MWLLTSLSFFLSLYLFAHLFSNRFHLGFPFAPEKKFVKSCDRHQHALDNWSISSSFFSSLMPTCVHTHTRTPARVLYSFLLSCSLNSTSLFKFIFNHRLFYSWWANPGWYLGEKKKQVFFLSALNRLVDCLLCLNLCRSLFRSSADFHPPTRHTYTPVLNQSKMKGNLRHEMFVTRYQHLTA